VEGPPVNQEIGCFKGLATRCAWIDSQVGEQAILRRSCWQHAGRNALQTGTPNRFMGREGHNPRMAVSRYADVPSLTNGLENAFDHLPIGVPPRLARLIRILQRFRGRIELENPQVRQEIIRQEKDLLSGFNPTTRFHRGLTESNPRADDGES